MREVDRLLNQASEVSPSCLSDFLAEACPDTGIRAEVESRLRYARDAESYFVDAIRSVAQSLRSSHELAPGEIIGCYRIVSAIGRGGMGSVYLAERADGEIQQRVAVKLLRADGHRVKWQNRFRKERQLLASLHHPAIVHVIDAGHIIDGRPFLVMEYVDGVPIDTYAAGLPVRDRLKLFLRVCQGVSHAHRRLIIHRDLKPSNILVDGSGQPKLLDFGIARLLDETSDDSQTVERWLTPDYASPEQMLGNAHTTATDVYSLGAVLYKLLTGTSPRAGIPAGAKEMSPPSRVNASVPRDVDFIVAKALRSEPEDRYVSVDEFASDVRAALDWRPVQARSGNIWYAASRLLRRGWMPATASAVVIASLSAGLWVANRQRALSERRFAQLRQLASRVIDLDRTIRTLPGSIDARRRLVTVSLDYLEGLSPEARRNLDLAQEIAEGYWRLGRIQGVNAEPNLGDPMKAEVSLKKADALMDTVLASRPRERNALFRSAVIAHDRMIVANTTDRRDDSLAHARKASDRLETFLQQDDPKNPVRLDGFLRAGDARQSERSGAALLYVNIALTYVNSHQYAEGARYAQRGAELAQPVSYAQDVVGSALSIRANALRYQGDLDGALTAIRTARQLSERATYPSRTARIFNRYGPLLREGLILGERDSVNLDRPGEAIDALRQALELTEEAAREDPKDAASRSRMGTVSLELGAVLRDRDPRGALAVEDLGITRLAEPGDRVEARRDRALLLAESSYALRRLNRSSEARARIDSALALLQQTNDYPAPQVHLGSPAYRVLCAFADHEAAVGNARLALEKYRELLDRIQVTRPDPLGDLRDAPKLAKVYGALAVLYRRTGDAATADRMNSERVDLWRHWQQKLPQNAFIGRQMQAPESAFAAR